MNPLKQIAPFFCPAETPLEQKPLLSRGYRETNKCCGSQPMRFGINGTVCIGVFVPAEQKPPQ